MNNAYRTLKVFVHRMQLAVMRLLEFIQHVNSSTVFIQNRVYEDEIKFSQFMWISFFSGGKVAFLHCRSDEKFCVLVEMHFALLKVDVAL